MIIKSDWIICPICGRKTHNKIREDTVLINYPLYCPKCRQETLISAKDFFLRGCCLPCSCNCLSLFLTLSLSIYKQSAFQRSSAKGCAGASRTRRRQYHDEHLRSRYKGSEAHFCKTSGYGRRRRMKICPCFGS